MHPFPGDAPGPAAVLCGFGGWVPEREVTNAELADRLDTSDEWIRQRTGITSRHVIAPGGATSDLAVAAGRRALGAAGTRTVDTVVLATSTPDHISPATAPDVASRLGLHEAAAFDVGAVCSGFVYGLAVATSLIRAGIGGSVLLIGADTYTTVVDPGDRTTAILFGDGAGAVVLRAGAPGEPGETGPFDLGSDGTLKHLILVPNGGSRQRSSDALPPAGHDRSGDYVRLNGGEVFKHAVRRMSGSALAVLDLAGWPPDKLGWLVPHQANQRIAAAVAHRLGIAEDRVLSNIARVGNTAGASIPLLLAEAWEQRLLTEGDRVVLTAFGADLTWGSAAITWPAAHP